MLKYIINKKKKKEKKKKKKKENKTWVGAYSWYYAVFITGNIHQNNFHKPFVQSDMKQHVMWPRQVHVATICNVTNFAHKHCVQSSPVSLQQPLVMKVGRIIDKCLFYKINARC